MIDQILIREEQQKDIKEIESLIYHAFLNHPHHEKGQNPTEHLIVNALRDKDNLPISLVAVYQNEIVGHIAYSKILINEQFTNCYGLAPLSVKVCYQNLGIGSKLVNESENWLKKLNAKACVVLGDTHFYKKLGFEISNSLILPNVPSEFFLSKIYQPNNLKGTVSFDDVFYSIN